MANYVEHDLYVKGKKSDIIKIETFLDYFVYRKDHSYKNSLSNTLIPLPNECIVFFSKERSVKRNTKEDVIFNECNHWMYENWGSGGEMDLKKIEEKRKLKNNTEKLKYEFDTKWTPHLKVIDKLAEKFDNLDIKLRYYEQGQQFKGQVDYKKGKKVYSNEEKYKGKRGG